MAPVSCAVHCAIRVAWLWTVSSSGLGFKPSTDLAVVMQVPVMTSGGQLNWPTGQFQSLASVLL